MIKVEIASAGKRFASDWIFRNLSVTFEPGSRVAISGNNGSGKSTLLQIVSGYLAATEGSVQLYKGELELKREEWFRHLALAAPYLDLPEDLNTIEIFEFQSAFRPFLPGIDTASFLQLTGLENYKGKAVKNFSSGMKQRLKLGLCLLSDSSLLLLDEPLSNLDAEGISWYSDTTSRYLGRRTVMVCSNNISEETAFCVQSLHINSYKPDVRQAEK